MTDIIPVTKFIPTGGITSLQRVRNGCNGTMFVHAVAGAAIYSAVAGAECGFPDGRSSFNMAMLSANGVAANVGFSQATGSTQAATYPSIPAATSFRFCFDVTNWTNRGTTATANAKLAQVGLMGREHANYKTVMSDGPQLSGASAIYVTFYGNTMTMYFGTTASSVIQIPTTLTAFSVRIEYRAGRGARLYLNNKFVAQIDTTVATSALQIFARAGHTTDFITADAGIRFEIDAITASYDKQ